MARKNKSRPSRSGPRPTTTPSAFEQARDEMFYHVIHCGVVESDPAHHDEWFDDTMRYLTERYPELEEKELRELRAAGERFAHPPKTRHSRQPATA